MNKNKNFRFTTRYLPILSILVAISFWFIDSAVDYYFFNEDNETFIETITTPEPIEIWMRSLVMLIMISFAFYTRKLFIIQHNITKELEENKYRLEEQSKELLLSNSLLSKEIEERKLIEKKLEKLANIDTLTQIYNRRKINEILNYEIQKNKRYKVYLSIIFCDIDHFKDVNDTYGHVVGDAVLSSFASILKNNLRTSDIIARWGGEEFIILVPSENIKETINITKKLKKAIESYNFEKVGQVTSSFGVTYLKDDDTEQSILKRVDEAMYKAKENGRNRIETLL